MTGFTILEKSDREYWLANWKIMMCKKIVDRSASDDTVDCLTPDGNQEYCAGSSTCRYYVEV